MEIFYTRATRRQVDTGNLKSLSMRIYNEKPVTIFYCVHHNYYLLHTIIDFINHNIPIKFFKRGIHTIQIIAYYTVLMP